jgi:hypothetical protein
MPNMWGQPHPWERAYLEKDDWMDVLSYTIRRWTAAKSAFDKAPSSANSKEHQAAMDEHWRVIDGDIDTCERILAKLHKDDVAKM